MYLKVPPGHANRLDFQVHLRIARNGMNGGGGSEIVMQISIVPALHSLLMRIMTESSNGCNHVQTVIIEVYSQGSVISFLDQNLMCFDCAKSLAQFSLFCSCVSPFTRWLLPAFRAAAASENGTLCVYSTQTNSFLSTEQLHSC